MAITAGAVTGALTFGIAAALAGPYWGGRRPPSWGLRGVLGLAVVVISLAAVWGDRHWQAWGDGLVAIGAIVAAVDGLDRIIPNRWVVATAAWGMAAGGGWLHWMSAVGTGLGLFVFYLLVHVATRGGLGMGDVKYGGALGLALGWPAGFLAMAVAVWAAGIYALAMLLLRKKGRKDTIALGPFLAFGGIIGVLGRLHG